MQANIDHLNECGDSQLQLWKYVNGQAVRRLDRFMEERVSSDASPAMINYVSMARYATLIEIARETLLDKFSFEDIHLMLAEDPLAWYSENSWCLRGGRSTIEYVLEMYMHDTTTLDPKLVALRSKVHELNTVQLLALTDLLECAGRKGVASIIEVTNTIP